MRVDTIALREFYATETLGAPNHAVGFVLWKLTHQFQREIDRKLRPLELTHLQFTTLSMVGWLNRAHGPTSQTEISRQADIHVMQLSQILTVLESKGMVVRNVSPENARKKCVEITRRGLGTLRRAMPIAIAVQRDLFGDAGAPGGALLSALNSVYETIRVPEREDSAKRRPTSLGAKS